jgi:hypothetical protein
MSLPKKPKKEQFKEGLKFDTLKARTDLISPFALMELALVYTYGAVKYEPRNMCKGIHWSRVIGALERHVQAFKAGEIRDPESGMYHIAQAMWCCATLIDYIKFHPEFDDRFCQIPPGTTFNQMLSSLDTGMKSIQKYKATWIKKNKSLK